LDFSKIKKDFRSEIVRGGEAFLEGQLKVATAADSRASSLAGMLVAAATALTAGVVLSLFNPAWNVPHRLPLMLGGGTVALLFFVGAVLCLLAIMPAGFYLPGCEPANWEDDINASKELEDCLGERAQHIQEQIVDNNQVIQRNARKFRWAASLGVAAPPLGLVVWLIAQFLDVRGIASVLSRIIGAFSFG
jgi:hypothetical protein